MLVMLHTRKGEMHFHLLGTNGYHAKAKNERFTAASSRCRQNLKYENFTSSIARLSQKIALKGVPHMQHDHFSSINQSNHWFVTLMLPSCISLTPPFLRRQFDPLVNLFDAKFSCFTFPPTRHQRHHRFLKTKPFILKENKIC